MIGSTKGLVPEANLILKAGAFGLGRNFDTLLLEEEFGFKPRYSSMERGVLKALNTFRRQAGLREVEG